MMIKAVGKVISNPQNGKRLEVEWHKDFEPKDWYFFTYRGTFWRINEQGQWWSQYASKLIDFAFKDKPQDYDYFVKNWSWNQEAIEMDEKNEMGGEHEALALNTILYGPPGTGKTFNTVDLAWQVLNPSDSAETSRPGSIQELKARYPGQVEFVTFHQSFSYEDFVEGIQAKSNDGKISYQIESGVFKRIAKSALKNLEDSQKSVNQLAEDLNFDKRYDAFITHAIESEAAFKKKKGTEFKIINTDDERLTVESPDSTFSGGEVQLKVEELKRVLQSDYPFQSAREVHEQIFINKYKYTRQEDTYYLSLVNAFRQFNVPVEPSSQADEVSQKPYVLIIDEINRGNISRIFGELITLIEPSKRAGNDEAIEVTLPYSKEPFSVPNNLYIIGTMNTADRSLALMDTALRRRFDFIEMMPQPDLVTEDLEGVNLRNMLAVMNQRIEALYDREHTLGHAFLMSVDSLDDLRHAFKNKILPLLEEYFYDDWQKIRWVLGASADNFYQRQRFSHLFTDADAPNDIEKFQRNNLDDLDAQAFVAIYQR
ncbi:McrB family protein [Thiomicrospira microaerophila]|uniref:McrB family protein n=1 Tax=Thiomicrospira microaerophila TaxID=406020 RepID=UPI00200F325C|nr:AAA family ATPase [Thiomicrospira microaerophila]